MSLSLFQPSFFMSKTRSYAQIIIGSRLLLTAMAIHLSLRVAPLDLQQGGNSRILYVHVSTAWMSILVYIATAINTFFLLLTKHLLFLRSFGIDTKMGAFFYLVDFSDWRVSGKTYVGHLLGVGCSFNLYIHLVPYLPGCTTSSKASCRTGFYLNPSWTDRHTNNQVFS
ncbi:hypothetical protein IC582_021909 [Cucumis melo]